jgi:hypothetical protein
MATELYFDTARLGRMCPHARKAEQDFLKLASQLGSSLYFERFLVEGHAALPVSLQSRVPNLQCWQGVTGLKRGRKQFVGHQPEGEVIFSSQSRPLISLAARCLFERCDSVLATDLEWPPYLAALKRDAVRAERRLHVLQLRQRVLARGMDASLLADTIVDEYTRRGQ